MTRSGFTLVELLVALVLATLTAGAVYRMLVGEQRLVLEQTERINANQAARFVAAILPAGIRELGDGDIYAAQPGRLEFRSFQNVYFACESGAEETIMLDGEGWFGLRALDPSTDSLMLFAEHDSATTADDGWVPADLRAAQQGATCPGGGAGIVVSIGPGAGAMALSGVHPGAPVRSYQVEQRRTYVDGEGVWWLGSQIGRKGSGGFSPIQPIAGPLAESGSGLSLAYFDQRGNETDDPVAVARVRGRITSRSRKPVRSGGATGYLTRVVTIEASLRNACHGCRP